MGIQAIETQYQGCRFRSRLEARWAVFFDAMGIKWEYEKEGYDCRKLGWYLPDFWLPDLSVWVEIKAGHSTGEEARKLFYVVESTDCRGGCFLTGVPSSVDPMIEVDDKKGERYFFTGRGGSLHTEIPIVDEPEKAADACISFRFSESGGVFQQVECPICGEGCVYSVKEEQKDSDVIAEWKCKWVLRIPMHCGYNHKWTLVLGFHERDTYIRIENPRKVSYDPLVWLGGGDVKRINKALTAARSARFEHSEAP